MNKQIKILIVLLLVAIGVYVIFTRKPWKSFSGDGSDFTITDTAAVTKIFLADAFGLSVTLTKQANGAWLVNDKFEADTRKLNLLLQTMHDVRMRNPIGKNEHNTIIKELAGSGVKAEFYTSNDLIKTIYIGQATMDKSGTYMMHEGAETPYVMHLPGFVGYLTPRFPTNPVKWKTKLIFNIPAEQITKVNVMYPQNPTESFEIENAATPILKNAQGMMVPTNTNFLKYYVASYNQMYGEAFDDEFTAKQHDSIFNTPVFCKLAVTDKQGKTYSLQLHTKGLSMRTKERYDEQGSELTEDAEKYFGFVNGEKDMMYIQQYNFGKLLRTLTQFREAK